MATELVMKVTERDIRDAVEILRAEDGEAIAVHNPEAAGFVHDVLKRKLAGETKYGD